MNFLSRLGAEGASMGYDQSAKSALPVRPRSLREQLQDQIAFHRAKITDLEDALSALTPDVEKALNALAKL